MKGKDLIKWIQENDLEEKEVYMHKYDWTKSVVTGVKKENLVIDECGDLLISSK